jgi:hypothetical protein
VCARRRTYLLLLRQKKVGQEKTTPLPVSPLARWASGAACDARSWGDAEELPALPLRGSSGQTASASQTTMRVSFGTRSPQALRFSARSEGGGSGLHSGHCFARPVAPSLRSARQGGCAQRVTDIRRSCAAAAVFVPAPHPCWLRREAQGLGWVRVPKDTRTSCSSLPMLFERSSKNAASSSAPPQFRASQVAPIARQGDGGRRLGAAFSFVTFSWRPRESYCAAGRTSRLPHSIKAKSYHSRQINDGSADAQPNPQGSAPPAQRKSTPTQQPT